MIICLPSEVIWVTGKLSIEIMVQRQIFSSDKNFEELNYVDSWTEDHVLIKIHTAKNFKELKIRGSVLSTKICTHRKYLRIRYMYAVCCLASQAIKTLCLFMYSCVFMHVIMGDQVWKHNV